MLNEENKKKVEHELWDILCEIDYEFIPPLSYRNSTTYKFGSKEKRIGNTDKPEAYFETLLAQEIIVCKKKSNNQVIGLMSFIPNYNLQIKHKNFVCYYVTTVGVTKRERGNGITNQFYKKVEKILKTQGTSKFIATRTWSTNKPHIKILSNLGYIPIYTSKNDRGYEIDTVYFAKQIIDK